MPTRPLVLVIRDGWGKNPYDQWNHANAVYLARHPVQDRLLRECPSTLIRTSGFDVGLPEGTMGNSEVGHQNIGAGRVVDQESVAITKQIRSGQFFENPVLNQAVDHALTQDSSVHLMGIVSDAGVHGLLEHLFACLELCRRKGCEKVWVHAFTDGRDTPPTSGRGYIRQVEAEMQRLGVGRMASVVGRFYAMDRDKRWDRVEKAYRLLTEGAGTTFPTADAAIEHFYAHPTDSTMQGDEFVIPSLVRPDPDAPVGLIRDGDSVIFYNYRGDRPRELTRAFVDEAFTGFARPRRLNLRFTTLTAYEEGLPVHVAYPKPPKMTNILGEYLSARGLKQFRCAETEKYPHVTFFFNDYREEPFVGEDRQIVPSPRARPDGTPIKTYDQAPRMSADGITDVVVERIGRRTDDLIVVNYANCDMVGHTGNLPACIQAVECVDECVGRVLQALREVGGIAIVTADHGNCEQMIDPGTGGPHTAHTVYPVELFVVDDRFRGVNLRSDGRLADVAPTALRMMGLEVPAEMTGNSLIP